VKYRLNKLILNDFASCRDLRVTVINDHENDNEETLDDECNDESIS